VRGLHLAAWLALGLLLRALRVGLRWDELSLAYAAYQEPTARALQEGRLLDAATTWVGLHPPLYSLLFGLSELLLPVPLLWLAGSALLSLLAVALVGRAGGPVAAAVLATSPVQLADAAEINNYPLATASLALVLLTARGPWLALALAAGLASWSHVLGMAGAGAVVGWRLLQPAPWGERLRLASASGLLAAPVLVGAFRRMAQPDTFQQAGLEPLAWLELMAQAIGPVGLLLGPLLLLGLRGPALACLAGPGLALGAALLLGAAAPHQRPYLDLLGPAAALGIAAGLDRVPGRGRQLLSAAVLLLCLGRGLTSLGGELQVARELRADQLRERALDLALAESAPGDTLWMVVPALQPDDDKSATGPLMWRLPPWTPMPIARPVAFEYTDYRYGQPREHRGRVIHSSTELDEQAFDHVAASALQRGRLFVVLADHGPATGLLQRVERALRPYRVEEEEVGEDRGLGVDRLYRVRGLAEESADGG